MLCEKYKPALIEAAITGADLPPAIRAHVDACPSCAAEFAQQHSLIAAIDTNLHRQMNAPVPAATLQRLEAHVAQEPQPVRAPRFAQIFVGTLATLAVVATIVLLLPRHGLPISDGKGIASQAAQNHADQSPVAVNQPSNTTSSLSPEPRMLNRTRTRTVLASTAASSHHEPEVLVPPDERIALAHFMADSNGRGDLSAAIARRVPEQEVRVAPLDVPDIQMASVTVAPIQESAAVTNR